MSDTDAARGQVAAPAAEVYEAFFVPALFGQWTPIMLERSGTRTGDHVLDVGCGTGVLARAARGRGSARPARWSGSTATRACSPLRNAPGEGRVAPRCR